MKAGNFYLFCSHIHPKCIDECTQQAFRHLIIHVLRSEFLRNDWFELLLPATHDRSIVVLEDKEVSITQVPLV